MCSKLLQDEEDDDEDEVDMLDSGDEDADGAGTYEIKKSSHRNK